MHYLFQNIKSVDYTAKLIKYTCFVNVMKMFFKYFMFKMYKMKILMYLKLIIKITYYNFYTLNTHY